VSLIDDFKVNLNSSRFEPNVHISAFLIALNNAWREKLHKKTEHYKKRFASTKRDSQRRGNMQKSTMEVIQRAQIQRLQSDLDKTRAEYLFRCNPEHKHGLLDLSLSTVENLSRQIMKYESENTQVKQENELLRGRTDGLNEALKTGTEQCSAWYSYIFISVIDMPHAHIQKHSPLYTHTHTHSHTHRVCVRRTPLSRLD
jgi:hypothetical protein